MQNGIKMTETEVFNVLSQIPDPEIPVISIKDLGILQGVKIENNQVFIDITPTYSGCPAMKLVEDLIHESLAGKGFDSVQVISKLTPVWTTDWLSDDAKRRLEEFGIAPPEKTSPNKSWLSAEGPKIIRCPLCKSENTIMVSQFGSTACKAHYKCADCLEPFDYFKCI
tara:strand:+ start:313 stop:816 length:504 start_codon:yes stop_codon:yes gene_type:complete